MSAICPSRGSDYHSFTLRNVEISCFFQFLNVFLSFFVCTNYVINDLFFFDGYDYYLFYVKYPDLDFYFDTDVSGIQSTTPLRCGVQGVVG